MWSRTLQKQLTFANNEKRHLFLASKLPTGNSDGMREEEEEREKATLKHSDTGAAVTESLINGS